MCDNSTMMQDRISRTTTFLQAFLEVGHDTFVGITEFV